MNELTRLATEAARSAGAVIMNGFEKPHDTSMKGKRELVTEIDRASEEIIIRAISAECPNDLIIAEETAPELADSRSPSRWRRKGSSQRASSTTL